MPPNRAALEALERDQLIQEARRYGVRRPEVMTRVELVDEVLRIGTPNPVERKRARGWLGVARDLVASLVEQGLNLPDAAALIRGDVRFEPLKPVHPPVATVTLAEIYGAQGHFQKAMKMLDDVLAKEPEHEAARKLRARLQREHAGTVPHVEGAVGSMAAAVFPEEPEPLTPRRASKQPPAAEESKPPDVPPAAASDAEPMTPRRLSKQPPAMPAALEAGDAEPLTPRRLSKQPPAMPEVSRAEIAEAEAVPDAEPLTPRRLSKQPPAMPEALPAEPAGAEVAYDAEPLTPRRLSKQPPAMPFAPEASDAEPLTPRRLSKRPPAIPVAPEALAAPAGAEPDDDEALIVRTSPTRAVVYFEVCGDRSNGDAALVEVLEWSVDSSGVRRTGRQFLAGGRRGTIVVDDLSPGGLVRAALGRKRHGRFKPLAVCAVATLQSGSMTVVWSPRSRKDYGALVARAAAWVHE